MSPQNPQLQQFLDSPRNPFSFKQVSNPTKQETSSPARHFPRPHDLEQRRLEPKGTEAAHHIESVGRTATRSPGLPSCWREHTIGGRCMVSMSTGNTRTSVIASALALHRGIDLVERKNGTSNSCGAS